VRHILLVFLLSIPLAGTADAQSKSNPQQPPSQSTIRQLPTQNGPQQKSPPTELVAPQQIFDAISHAIDAAADKAKSTQNSTPPNNSSWWFNLLLVIFTCGLVAVGGVQCVLIFRTLRATMTAATAAQDAAQAALLQANALIAIEQPIIMLAGIELRDISGPFRRERGEIVTDIPRIFSRITVTFKNGGRTAAPIKELWIEPVVVRHLPREPIYRQRFAIDSVIQADGTFVFAPLNFAMIQTEEERTRIAGRDELWVYGHLVCEGVGSIINLGFSRRWIPISQASGGPAGFVSESPDDDQYNYYRITRKPI
jgi:hypothetical protein